MVYNPVVDTVNRQVQRTVYRQVTETVNQERKYHAAKSKRKSRSRGKKG